MTLRYNRGAILAGAHSHISRRGNSRKAGTKRAKDADHVDKDQIHHHTNSVSSHPNLAAERDNAEGFDTEVDHRRAHGGNYQNPTSGPLQDPSAKKSGGC